MAGEEKRLEQEAVRWVRRAANKRQIIKRFASPEVYLPSAHPILIFTAGSPGAGKTEFIKAFKKPVERLFKMKLVTIDPDAIRTLMPGYTGSNSYLFQRAVSIAVDDLFRAVRKNSQSAFIDGTLSDYERASKNIESVIRQYSSVTISYIFQHPAIAWHFTQLREAVEGRNIQKKDFIDKFLGSRETVNKLKVRFGDALDLVVVLKDYKDVKENKAIEKVFSDVATIEECFPFGYTKTTLRKIIK